MRKMISCSKCKIQDDALYVEYPETNNDDCDIWSKRGSRYFCTNCAEELINLEQSACEKILINFIQPERSKREDLREIIYFLYESNPYRTFVRSTLSKNEAIEWSNSGTDKNIKTYKEVYKDAVL